MRLFIIAFVVLLTGCSWTKTLTVKDTEYHVVDVPSAMTIPVPVPRPPNREQYMTSTIVERESLLTKYTISIMRALDKCNDQLRDIATFNEKTVEKWRSVQ